MNSDRADGVYIGKAKNTGRGAISAGPFLPLSVIPDSSVHTSGACSGSPGSEHAACAGAITLARQWGQLNRHGHCGVVLASGNRFDGLIASMASDLSRVPLNDLAALNAAIDSHTVAIMIEPSPCDAATASYLQGAESLCRALNILLLINETQSRPGQWTASPSEDACGVRADIVILGHCLDGAVPGAVLIEPSPCDAATASYLQGAESLCRALNILLLINETQSRPGQWTASPSEEACGVRADIVILAHCLDGAVPGAVLLARGQVLALQQAEARPSAVPTRPTLAFSRRGIAHTSRPQALLA